MGHGHHHHDHHHDHHHGHHHHQINEKNILFTVVLNLLITISEFVGGFLSNSLALLSDAVHNLSDTIAILLAYLAMRIGKKSSNLRHTYGFKRYEILAALLNAVALVVISIYLFVEAYHRLLAPEPVGTGLMLAVGLIGLLANALSILLLRKDHTHNLNIKSAYIHLLGDTLSSVGVIVGGVAMHFWGWFWIDPLITVVIGIVIIKHAVVIIKEAVDILVMSTPDGIDNQVISKRLQDLPAVKNVHHVHSWCMRESEIYFDCHIDLTDDLLVSEADALRNEIVHILENEFNITHSTLQLEFNCCADKGLISGH